MSALHTDVAPALDSVPALAALSVWACGNCQELEQFRGSWNSLLEQNPTSSIFQTPEWLAAWWLAFGKDKKFLGLVFRDAKGNTVGIAPLYSERKSFPG